MRRQRSAPTTSNVRRFEYQNPETVAIIKESKTCAGCKHTTKIFGDTICTKGKPMDRRCKLYKTDEPR